ncbi:hypothetical protein GCM10023321_26380 [Pseudonocardia eucalypti]|uniref:Helicase C-terminal domain-containing protein n=2 Tax=Pseudonocardia eucalypti TaxID=648755 RepID=A0ABP9Q0I3_9PSEU
MINLLRIVDPRLAYRLEERFDPADDIFHDADEFRGAVSRRYLRRAQNDVLQELPPLTLVDVPIDLNSDEIDRYKAAVASGHMTHMRIAASSSGSKMAALRDIADEARNADRKMVVFSEYVHVLNAAAASIGSESYVIHGTVSDKEKAQREEDFKKQSGFAALVGQIKVIGVGKNYQQASVVVLMEPQFTPAAEHQAIARAHRMGQTESVVCHRLVAMGTVDERIVKIVALKSLLINELSHKSNLEEELRKFGGKEVNQTELVREEQRRLGVTPPPQSQSG